MTVQLDSGFAMRLKEERHRLGLSQNRLGAFGGVAANAQAHYENGKRCPKSDYLSAIAKIGVDTLYLLSGNRSSVRSESMSASEQLLVENYRAMSRLDQGAVAQLLASVAGNLNGRVSDPQSL